MAYITYTNEHKAAVMALAISAGYPKRGSKLYIKQISGSKHETLDRWYKTVNLKLLDDKIMELQELIEKELKSIFGSMDEKRKSATYKDLVTGVGILSDKYIVLTGGTNSRNETIIKDWRQAVLDARGELEHK